MWAEIIIRCKRDLPANLASALRVRFDDQTDLKTAVNATFLKDNAAIANLVIYGQISSSRIILVFRPESRTLRMHVETALKKESLRGLKREVEGVIGEIDSFVRQYDNKPKDTTMVIWGNDDEIMYGNVNSWYNNLKTSLLEDVIIKSVVPVVTYIISFLMDQEPKKALVNAIIALSSLLLFAIIKSFISPKSKYKEV